MRKLARLIERCAQVNEHMWCWSPGLCWQCKRRTRWIQVDFHTYLCPGKCTAVAWEQYWDAEREASEQRTFTMPNGLVLRNVHDSFQCVGRPCVIHNPTDHHMRGWTLHWRDDRGIFERLCPEHGTGHPDPDQFDYWKSVGEEWQGIHGCCFCCREPA